MPTRILLGLGLVIGGLATSVFVIDSCHRKQGQQQEVQVAVHQGAAETHQAAAQAQDAQVPALKKRLQDSQAEVDALKAELAQIQTQGNVASVDPPDYKGIIDGQSKLIVAQDKQITVLKEEVVVLTQARDEWKKTAEEREKQALAQAAATAAWKSAVSSSTNKGRIQGFAVGVALGFLGGRR